MVESGGRKGCREGGRKGGWEETESRKGRKEGGVGSKGGQRVNEGGWPEREDTAGAAATQQKKLK